MWGRVNTLKIVVSKGTLQINIPLPRILDLMSGVETARVVLVTLRK